MPRPLEAVAIGYIGDAWCPYQLSVPNYGGISSEYCYSPLDMRRLLTISIDVLVARRSPSAAGVPPRGPPTTGYSYRLCGLYRRGGPNWTSSGAPRGRGARETGPRMTLGITHRTTGVVQPHPVFVAVTAPGVRPVILLVLPSQCTRLGCGS